MDVNKIMVIGSGQMGSGIAQISAQAGFEVVFYDQNLGLVKKGLQKIRQLISRDVQKGKKTLEEVDLILRRITPSTDLEDARDVDFVIEAVIEYLSVKQEIFHKLDHICPAHTVLASNTSSLSITEIASVTKRPSQVVGMHFMNPVPVMKLVEVIRGISTSDEVYHSVEQLSQKMEKVPVEVKDFPGFVANRILLPMINEAIYCVYEGIATPEAIDEIMKLGMSHPMGPLTLADFIGLDTCLYIMEVLYEGFADPKYRPCPLLRKYVKAGWLGRKTARGFYRYDNIL